MQVGTKPSPQDVPNAEDPYWLKPFYDAIEITYLAIAEGRQHQHIGSYVIERIMDKIASDADTKCDFLTVRALKVTIQRLSHSAH